MYNMDTIIQANDILLNNFLQVEEEVEMDAVKDHSPLITSGLRSNGINSRDGDQESIFTIGSESPTSRRIMRRVFQDNLESEMNNLFINYEGLFYKNFVNVVASNINQKTTDLLLQVFEYNDFFNECDQGKMCSLLLTDARQIKDSVLRRKFIHCLYEKYISHDDMKNEDFRNIIFTIFDLENDYTYLQANNLYHYYFYYPLFRLHKNGLEKFMRLPALAQMMNSIKETSQVISQAANVIIENEALATMTLSNVASSAAQAGVTLNNINNSIPNLVEAVNNINATAKKSAKLLTKVNTFINDESEDDSDNGEEVLPTRKPKFSLLDIKSLIFDNAQFVMAINDVSSILKLMFMHEFNLIFKLSIISTYLPKLIKTSYKGGKLFYSFFKMVFDFVSRTLAQGSVSFFEILYNWFIKVVPIPFTYNFIYNTVSQYNGWSRFSNVTGLTGLLQSIKEFFAWISPFASIADYLDSNRIDKKQVNDYVANVIDFTKAFELKKEEYLKSDDMYQLCINLQNQQVNILGCIMRIRKDNLAAYKGSLREYFDLLDKINDEFVSYRLKKFSRITPRCIRLYGKSQVGKSTIATLIAKHLLYIEEDQIYTRNVNDAYWSGYSTQKAVIFDDNNQDTQLKDVMELFDLVTCNKVLPPMPDLNNTDIGKKGTPFNSPLIILCSNIDNIGNLTSKIHCPEAYYNRIHDEVEIIKVGDYDKDFKHLTFLIKDASTNLSGDYISKVKAQLNFEEFMQYLEENFYTHISKEHDLKTTRSVALSKIKHKYTKDEVNSKINVIGQVKDSEYETAEESRYNVQTDEVTLNIVSRKPTLMAKVWSEIKELDYALLVRHALYGAVVGFGIGTLVGGFVRLMSYLVGHIYKQCVTDNLIDNVKQFCKNNDIEDQFANIYGYINHVKNGTLVNSQSWDAAQVKDRKVITKSAGITYAQGDFDLNAKEIIENCIIPSIATIVLTRADDKSKKAIGVMSALAIRQNLYLVPRHLVPREWKDDEYYVKVALQHDNGRRQVILSTYLTKKNCVQVNNDACIIDFEAGTDYVKDIVGKFIKEEELYKYASPNDFHDGELILRRKEIVRTRVVFQSLTQNEDYYARMEKYILVRGFQYRATTQDGDCGGVLVRYDDKEPRKIIGMHIAATIADNKSFAILVTQNEILAAIEKLKPQAVNIEIRAQVCDVTQECKLDGNIKLIGQLEREFSLYQPTKSELQHSILYGCFKPTKGPAVLSNKDKRLIEPVDRSILERQLMKYSQQPLLFQNKYIEELEEWCCRYLDDMNHTKEKKQLLTYDECLNGMDNLERINPNSSSGLPYLKTIVKPGKRDYMEFCNNDKLWKFTAKGKKLLDDCFYYEERAKTKTRCTFLWSALLKDELRSLEKVSKGSTRAFIGCPFPFVLVFRRYFGDFINFLHKNGPAHGFTTGINPESDDWNELFSRLLKMASNFLGYDIKEFDANVIWQLIKVFLKMVNYYYNDGQENANVREVLMHEVCFTFIVVFNVLYMKSHGVPSGLPMTVELDSWISLMYMMLSFMIIHERQFGYIPPYELFRSNVAVSVNGDDNTSAVRKEVGEWYNNITISEVLKEHNIKVTSAQKTEISKPFLQLEEVEYLKRNVGYRNGKYIPLMSRETIENMVMWVRDPVSNYEATMMTLQNAQMFMYFYEKQEFDKFTEIVKNFLINKGFVPRLNTWRYYDDLYHRKGKFDIYDPFDLRNLAMVETEMQDLSNFGIIRAQVGEDVLLENHGIIKMAGEVTTTSKQETENSGMHEIVCANECNEVGFNTPMAKVNEAQKDTNIRELVNTPVRIAFGNWTTGGAAGTVLKSFSLPQDIFSGSIPKYTQILRNFKFLRAKIVFTVELNGTPFHEGKLLLVLRPDKIAASAPYNAANTQMEIAQGGFSHTLTELYHVPLYASLNNSATLEVPWLGDYSYYYYGANTTNFNTYARVYLVIQNALAVGTGSTTSINWTMYAQLKDIETLIINPQNSAQFLDFTMVNNSIQQATNASLPMNFTGDELDTKLSIPLPMDSITNTISGQPMIRRVTNNYNNCDGVFPHNRFDLHPRSTAITRKQDFGFEFDEMDLRFFKNKFSYEQTISISNANAAGTSLLTGIISPFDMINTYPGGRTGNIVTTASSLTRLSIPGWWSGLCKYWRGTLRFKFEFICTQYHTMKVFIAFQYGLPMASMPATVNTGTIDPFSGQGILFELNKGSNEVILDVPFRHVVEWCSCNPNSSFTGTEGFNTYNPMSYFIGSWGVYVVNPLIAPGNTPTTIQMNNYIAFGDDFEFSGYNPFNSLIQGIRLAQSLQNGYLYPVNSLRDMMKRKVCIGTLSTTAAIQIALIDPLFEWYKAQSTVLSAYRVYKGGLRASFILDSALNPGQNVYIFWIPYLAGEGDGYNNTSGTTQSIQIADMIQSYLQPTMIDVTETAATNRYGTTSICRKYARQGASVNKAATFTQVGGSEVWTAFNLSQGVFPMSVEILSSQAISCDIEIPYQTNLPITQLDLYQAGTFAVYSANACTVRIFMSGADDFRAGQFSGTPMVMPAGYTTTGTPGRGGYAIGLNRQD